MYVYVYLYQHIISQKLTENTKNYKEKEHKIYVTGVNDHK